MKLNYDCVRSVVSNINTVYDTKYKGKPVCWHCSGNYVYAFENHGFDKYNFFDKELIE